MSEDCRTCREAVSARLDGEDPGWPARRIDQHLATCIECVQFADAIQHPSYRSTISGATPTRLVTWAQRALLVIAATLAAVALVSLIAATGEHATREVAGLELTLAVGMTTVALRPGRARALMPVVATAAAVIAWSTLVDLAGGATSALTEAHHGLELAGAAFVIALARPRFTGFDRPPGLEP